jgi:hypothetical protein
MSAIFPSLNENIQWFFDEIYGMQRCRAKERYSDMTWENFRLRFPDMIGLFFHATLPGPVNPPTSWRIPKMSDFVPNFTTPIVMPATCTYESWKNTGLCALQWTGLQSMLKMGITLRGYAKDCGAYNLPEVKVECIGSGCELFVKPKLCTSTNDCPTGSQCFDVYDELFVKMDENATMRDIVQAFFRLTTAVIPDQCGSEENGRKTVRDILKFIRGEPSDGGIGTKICMANFTQLFEDFNFTQWAEAQVTVDADEVTLHTILPWHPVGVTGVSRPTEVTVSFQVTGDASTVNELILKDYPGAEVVITPSLTTSLVRVILRGPTSEGTAATLTSDLRDPQSSITDQLGLKGVVTHTSTIETQSEPSRIIGDPIDGSAGTLTIFAAVGFAVALFVF